jgi:acyl dehydratase
MEKLDVRKIDGPAELKSLAGQEVGVSDWMEITQSRINQFAEATGDHQWIHVDPDAARDGPFGTTIAHGYLTLSLLPPLMAATCEVAGKKMGVNYGLNKVRFPAPVPVGSRIRLRLGIDTVEDVAADGVQIVWLATIEREGDDKPVCVAEALIRYYF